MGGGGHNPNLLGDGPAWLTEQTAPGGLCRGENRDPTSPPGQRLAYLTFSSVRRFWARPSRVLLSATGCDSP
jgi:hypothetical protein